MKQLLSLILVLGTTLSALGMDKKLEHINAIKKNADYLYGESTMQTQEEATSLAFENLQKEVLAWAQRDDKSLKVTSAAEINSLAGTIMTRRANMYRVFVYVKKSDLIDVNTSIPASPKDTVKAEVHPKDTTTVKSPQPKDSIVTDSVRNIIKQRFLGRRQNDALLRLQKAKNFFELKTIMQPLKAEGKILDYGKYATAKAPELCYLIVYDPAGNIRALLGKGKDKRKNLKTGKDDNIGNYRGCGAIWFTLKED